MVVKLPLIGTIDAKFLPGQLLQLLFFRSMRTKRVEELMASKLKLLGPVITIAKPGEKLSQLGAARISFEEDRWQSGVTDLMRKAQLIVIQAGGSAGLRWELGQSFALEPFKPLLVCTPPRYDEAFLTREDQYGLFRRALLAEFPKTAELLPQQMGNVTHFFFSTPQHFEEYEIEEGPPMAVLDQIETGTSERFQRNLKKRMRLFFLFFAIFFIVFMYGAVSHLVEIWKTD